VCVCLCMCSQTPNPNPDALNPDPFLNPNTGPSQYQALGQISQEISRYGNPLGRRTPWDAEAQTQTEAEAERETDTEKGKGVENGGDEGEGGMSGEEAACLHRILRRLERLEEEGVVVAGIVVEFVTAQGVLGWRPQTLNP
jgi:hypothetical protein